MMKEGVGHRFGTSRGNAAWMKGPFSVTFGIWSEKDLLNGKTVRGGPGFIG